MVELKLPFNLSVEADGLYRPYNATGSAGTITFNNTYSVWEFPVLAKYRFAFPIVKPYIEAGPSFRTGASAINHFISNNGFTVGGGVDVHALLHISPEFRYTHWGSDSSGTNPFTFQSNQNQVEFLVGFSF